MKRLLRNGVVLVLVVIAFAMVFTPLATQAAPEDVPRVCSLPSFPIVLVAE